ncbi:tRNA (guanosine(46)-N7)-methyltransferase TrmB [Buchnera aphidicola]|uniref:tRNA (guanosine(46)-N7)-methyltransferase TrmB n=1 Tax=Buchnera aphidicola TaxID=9 RepID=UPI003463CFB2
MKKIILNSFIIPKYNKFGKFLRPIKSFQLRSRYLKEKKIDFLKKYFFLFGINFKNSLINIHTFYSNDRLPIILDIGFGNGESLFYTCSHFINCNILGIEVYLAGIYNFIKKIFCTKKIFHNLKIIMHDAVEVLQYMIQNNSISIVQCFFPDPWPKKRHNKRRIINKQFIELVITKMILGGILHIITDCVLYYNNIIKLMKNFKYFVDISKKYDHDIINNKIKTKFSNQASLHCVNNFNIIFQLIK